MNRQPVVADVALDVTLECMDAAGNRHRIDTVLGYHRPDAYAITMTFMTGDEPLTWTFARDLLISGMHAPTGDGDVHIFPSITNGRAVIVITLSSPDGHLLLEARTDQVSEFIEGTLELVPAGSESSQVNVDDLIAQILS
ncbi:MAG: SsgA family sporulation/cell division regulator [Nocardioides sp.]|uniref:SsgA family sporulation/cell division regulator n=1 Tax=Nocardioides sp. TaxID=35761 RepID=UPI003265B338